MIRILVVEDDHDSRELICKLLEKECYEVVCASNGWEALLVLDQRPVDLILLDVAMPGMDGAVFLRIIRNDIRRGGTPVVIVTAFAAYEIAARIGHLKLAAILQKGDPEFIEKLIEQVRRFGSTNVKSF